MIKKLDKLILRTFIGPFLLTFAVVEFILLLVNIVQYMEEISGKDLGFFVYVKLFSLFALNIVPAALPLAVLLSSLMTFGGLGEHRELTAIKSAGISLLRILKPVFTFVTSVTILLFIYGNTIIPWANLELYSFLYDIKQKKPTMEFKEGVFYDGLPGYRIKINEKYGDGSYLKDVMIYDHTEGKGNTDVILADSGKIYTINDNAYLVMELYSGQSYKEFEKDRTTKSKERFIRSNFQTSKIVFNLSSFAFERTKKDLFKDHKLMKTIDELREYADSLHSEYHTQRGQLKTKAQKLFEFQLIDVDSITIDTSLLALEKGNLMPYDTFLAKVVEDEISIGQTLKKVRSVKSFTSSNKYRIARIRKDAKRYDIEYWKKFAIPFSCVVLFLIGAPLGAIIKKGGLGIPVIISIFFFIILYVINEQGRKSSLHNEIQPWYGMWMSNLYLLPFGFFFLFQARNDSNVLELDYWRNLIRKLLFLK